MEKLECGMYVRTDEGIAKVIEKRKNPYGEETIFIIDKPFMYHLTDFLRTAEDMIDVNFEEDTNQIKGASNNIIDLIEVGDVLNVSYLQYDEIIEPVYDAEGKCVYVYDFPTYLTDDNLVINSIVTKEQFENLSYKVV